jgi:hypothetical protein|tara:strand:+ start:5239 stop:5874 length:636 start_codon:yes stop_codon:yes gene_type:complete
MNIFERLNAVQQEVSYIQKEQKSGMRYSIVSHDAVTKKVRPAMVKHGVVYWPNEIYYRQNGNRTEAHIIVRFQSVNSERSDFIDVSSLGYGIDQQDKGPGKAISYGVKYALLKVLGLETGDDPDLDQDTEFKPDPKKTEPVKKAEAPTKDSDAKDWTLWVDSCLSSIKKCETEKERDDFRLSIQGAFYEAPQSAQRLVSQALTKRKKELLK